MRVSVVARETIHHRETDATRRLASLIDSLAGRGHDVVVHTTRFWDDVGDVIERDGVGYRSVVSDTSARRAFAVRLPLSIPKASPDVVHARADPPAAVWASRGATVARAPTVVEWYGDGETPPPKSLAVGDVVVTPSQLVRTRVREGGIDGDDVLVIPDSVAMDRIRSVDPASPADIVYARRLDGGANLDSVLLGLAELRQHDWSATVIGDGPARADYEQQARDLRIDDRIDFVGACDRDERISVYRAGHVFCQTATDCSFPTELLWAMAAGCVGIVEYHTDSSAHELVEGRERGFRTTSKVELAEAIHEAGDLEALSVDDSFETFDTDAVLETYLECYRTLQSERGLL
jgi:glycosyltransferase involved in cell wall biosynthesis